MAKLHPAPSTENPVAPILSAVEEEADLLWLRQVYLHHWPLKESSAPGRDTDRAARASPKRS